MTDTTDMSDRIDHEYTKEVVCPFFGYEMGDSWELGDDGVTECCECERSFAYERIVDVHYSTRPVKPCAHLNVRRDTGCTWKPGKRFSYPDVECYPCAYRDHLRAEALRYSTAKEQSHD